MFFLRDARCRGALVLSICTGLIETAGRERAKPLDPVQDPQRLHQRTERGALAAFEVLDRIQGDARPLGQLPLVEVLPQPERPHLPAELNFPLHRASAQHYQ